ncbi:MAG: hydroxylamine reductase, partial [Firmicutes bacterium]|nr:hydroxylamine reductase [Bacillota bacterium]
MFCFQCEQTAGCTGCTRAGVCGKSAMTAMLQDTLTGALIALANTTTTACSNKNSNHNPTAVLMDEINHLILEGLFTTITNVNFDDASIKDLTAQIRSAKENLSASYQISSTADYDMNNIWNADEDIRSLKSLILFGVRGMAAYAYHAMVLGYTDASLNQFFVTALSALSKDWGMNELLPIVMEVGRFNLLCMELLDTANTESFGDPVPVTVSLTVEKGPFIVVTGHDLSDIKQLLEQTKDTGINIYTHGEMLPAHAYPELKKYPHLKGNFGTAWQNQQKEFAALPAPILFTTNCLMPPKSSYADRVFTTGSVQFPNTPYIKDENGHKDF